jgi:flagellar protein FlaJ
VLSTAAQSSENQDDIDRERKSRTRMQTVIILMTYLTLLGVMALLRVQFIDVIGGLQLSGGGSGAPGGGGLGGGGSLDPQLMSMLFFHAVTLQAIISSFIAGYIRNVQLISGVKYAVTLATISLIVWIAVEQVASGDGGSAQALLLLVGSAGTSVWHRGCTEAEESR